MKHIFLIMFVILFGSTSFAGMNTAPEVNLLEKEKVKPIDDPLLLKNTNTEQFIISKNESFNILKATEVRFIISYSFSEKANSDGNFFSDSIAEPGILFDLEETYSKTLGIGLEAVVFKRSNFSIAAGTLFEFQRILKSASLSILGNTLTVTPNDPPERLAIFTPFFNFYSLFMRKMSFVVGVGAAFPVVADSSVNYRASVMYQFGVVFHLNPRLSLDALYKTQTFKRRDSANIDLGNGIEAATSQESVSFKGLAIQLRFGF